ncbi:MAG: HDOD domain-containing protein [Candidatus Sumerlaeota bacterium]|nr:HDOD domain-containing protein [Candidatus Sumerlaeota bacterium]
MSTSSTPSTPSMPPNTPAPPKPSSPPPPSPIAEILASGVNLPPLSAVSAELLSVGRQPIEKIEIKRVTELIERDPSLAAKILRMANSPYFGAIGEVTGLRQAIVLIGLMETLSTLHFYILMKTMPRFPAVEGFSPDNYWTHSWACAIAARMLGRPQLLIRSLPGELYLAGLLHGIGKITLAMKRKEQFAQCLALAREKSIPLHQAERDFLGFTDAALGARMLQAWNIPVHIRAAVEFCVAPAYAPEPYREIAAVTQMARLMVHHLKIGSSGSPCEADWADSWLATQSASPLSNPKTRAEAMEEIGETLRKKARLLGAMDVGLGDAPESRKADAPQTAGSQKSILPGAFQPGALKPAASETRGDFFSQMAAFIRGIFIRK